MGVQISTERMRIAKMGHLDSSKMNQFNDSVVLDLQNLATDVNAAGVTLDNVQATINRKLAMIEQRLTELEAAQDFNALVRSADNLRIPAVATMGELRNIEFLDASTDARRPAINTIFGQATTPIDGIQSKFYSTSVISGSITPITTNLDVTVDPVFTDPGAGSATDHESGAIKVVEGTPKMAFNGDNQEAWGRRVEFDLDSDVTEVQCQLTVIVPSQANSEANVLYVRPYPVGSVDVLNVETAGSLTDSFAVLPGFESVNNCPDKRWFFTSQSVQQVRVTIRSRNWFEENGKKVFRYGLQELGLQLVEFDKTYDATASASANNSFVTEFKCPEGYNFAGLHAFATNPDFTKESLDNRHMHFKICGNADGTDVKWDSDSNVLPQTLVQPIALGGGTSIYVVTTLNFCETVDSVSPLFPVNTTPFLESIGIQYSVTPSA